MSDAKPLTTKEVDALHVVTEYEGESTLLVDRDDLLATTRALETAQVALRDEKARIDSIAETFDELGTGYLARAEKAERERDEARGEARAHRAALDDATASCHGLGCGRCEDCVSMQRARAEKAEAERDAARATIVELVEVLAMALGWAECDAKSLAAIEARKRWPDQLPTGFETRVARLRSALAKVKGAANG